MCEFIALRNDLSRWHDYERGRVAGEDKPSPEDVPPLRKFFWPDESIRNAADPLAAILDRHPPEEDPDLF